LIKEAAIFKDGIIWTGRRHSDCISKMIQSGEVSKKGIQGFITDDGRFVDRQQAFEIALACGQIPNCDYNVRILFSDHLY